jgi:hypothetical protein
MVFAVGTGRGNIFMFRLCLCEFTIIPSVKKFLRTPYVMWSVFLIFFFHRIFDFTFDTHRTTRVLLTITYCLFNTLRGMRGIGTLFELFKHALRTRFSTVGDFDPRAPRNDL